MHISDRVCDAITAACIAHGSQKDKGGGYIAHHVLRVGLSLLPDEDAAIVGLLHDMLEHYHPADKTQEDVLQDIVDSFGARISATVSLLTRDQETTYEEYIAQLSESKLARKVKLADIADNMRADRHDAAKAAGHDLSELIARYREARHFLMGMDLIDDGEIG